LPHLSHGTDGRLPAHAGSTTDGPEPAEDPVPLAHPRGPGPRSGPAVPAPAPRPASSRAARCPGRTPPAQRAARRR
jgi:hypothetical protein